LDLPTYYRQTGICGRDKKPCWCIMFYRPENCLRVLPHALTEQKENTNYKIDSFWEIISYCQQAGDANECRQSILDSLMGHPTERHHSKEKESTRKMNVDATKFALELLKRLKHPHYMTFSDCVRA
jgi:superfamily II DNA helicase RecQ